MDHRSDSSEKKRRNSIAIGQQRNHSDWEVNSMDENSSSSVCEVVVHSEPPEKKSRGSSSNAKSSSHTVSISSNNSASNASLEENETRITPVESPVSGESIQSTTNHTPIANAGAAAVISRAGSVNDENVEFKVYSSAKGYLSKCILKHFSDFVKFSDNQCGARCKLCGVGESIKKFQIGNVSNLKTHLSRVKNQFFLDNVSEFNHFDFMEIIFL